MNATSAARPRIDRVTGSLGAVVHGIDLRELDDAATETIERALLEHQVVFFPGQALSAPEFLSFGGRLGEPEPAPIGPSHPDHRELTVLDQDSPKGQGTDAWHSDNTFREEPPKYTILQAEQLPPTGGDTCWADMYRAYESLSAAMQRFLDGLTASHDLTKILALAIANGHSDADLTAMRAQYPPRSHPVVRTHPVTGRKALFVNGNFTTKIDQLGDDESRRLLDLLFTHVKTPDFHYRHRWSEGTVAVWDNRCVQHYAVPDYASRRRMLRMIIRGDRPY